MDVAWYVGETHNVDGTVTKFRRATMSVDGPAITPRRPLDDDKPDGYLESDRDFVANNFDACVAFLKAATGEPQ